MSKILAVSDIHIYDYPQRNPVEKYRLYQTRNVCQNIIEVGEREGCDIIVLAGDIIEKFLIRPYIQSEVINNDFGVYDSPDEFFLKHKQEMSKFKEVLYRNIGRHLMNRNVNRIRRKL